MWSMMSRPGERRIESAAACEGRFKFAGADFTKLGKFSQSSRQGIPPLTDEAHRLEQVP